MSDEQRPSPTLVDAHATLEAIASGSVDAVVVNGPHGAQVFHLEGPDKPFRTLVEHIEEGALTLSAEGTILYANAFLARLLGVSIDDVIGSPLSQFVPSQYAYTLTDLISRGLDGPIKGQLQLQGAKAVIPIQLTLSPLDGGAVRSCCGILFDLREREQAEKQHAALVAAEQAALAKDQFLAVLSHELRSPLNAMLGWAQILSNDKSLSDEGRRAAQTIERNARTQAQLIGDLLDISRIIAGKLHLELSHVDLTVLTETALSAARPAMAQRGLVLRQALAEEADIFADPTRIQQIITNLLNNAIKFSDDGGSIDVILRTKGNEVELQIADTGAGMNGELVDRVFDAFYQGGSTQKRKGGLGLGLAIAKQLAEAHGGTVVAKSGGEGLGSTFVLRLPLSTQSERAVAASFEPHQELKGVRILAVDDEEDNIDLVRYMLESAGADVTTADVAEKALQLLETSQFDLMISDIGLPDQDGLHLMREVRARGHTDRRLPAIALTGYAGNHDVRLVKAAGYQRHLAKPVDATVLLRAAVELTRGG